METQQIQQEHEKAQGLVLAGIHVECSFKEFPLSWEENMVPLGKEGVPNIMHIEFTTPA